MNDLDKSGKILVKQESCADLMINDLLSRLRRSQLQGPKWRNGFKNSSVIV